MAKRLACSTLSWVPKYIRAAATVTVNAIPVGVVNRSFMREDIGQMDFFLFPCLDKKKS